MGSKAELLEFLAGLDVVEWSVERELVEQPAEYDHRLRMWRELRVNPERVTVTIAARRAVEGGGEK